MKKPQPQHYPIRDFLQNIFDAIRSFVCKIFGCCHEEPEPSEAIRIRTHFSTNNINSFKGENIMIEVRDDIDYAQTESDVVGVDNEGNPEELPDGEFISTDPNVFVAGSVPEFPKRPRINPVSTTVPQSANLMYRTLTNPQHDLFVISVNVIPSGVSQVQEPTDWNIVEHTPPTDATPK